MGERVDYFRNGWSVHNGGHCDGGHLCLLCHHSRQH